MQSVADSELGYRSLEDTLSRLLERIRSELGVDTAAVLLLDEDRGVLVARAARGLEPDGDCLVHDLGETRYLDSAALDMLFRLHDRLHQRRGSLYLVIPPDSALKRLVAIVGLPKLVPVHETVAAALSACSQLRDERGPNDSAAAGTEAEGSHGLPGGHGTK